MAQPVGLSVEYVVRLGQARGLQPSAAVLTALTCALRLERDEIPEIGEAFAIDTLTEAGGCGDSGNG